MLRSVLNLDFELTVTHVSPSTYLAVLNYYTRTLKTHTILNLFYINHIYNIFCHILFLWIPCPTTQFDPQQGSSSSGYSTR
jgi:hypothetical protein